MPDRAPSPPPTLPMVIASRNTRDTTLDRLASLLDGTAADFETIVVDDASGLTAVFPRSELLNSEACFGRDRGTESAVDIVTGLFLMIRRATRKTLEGFDPAFFMYGEETDLRLRARRRVRHRARRQDGPAAVRKTPADRPAFHGLAAPPRPALLTAWPLSRMIATRALGAITARAPLRAAAASWSGIRARRAEGRRGWRA